MTDTTNGFRAVRRAVLEDPRIDLEPAWLDRYALEPYFLIRAIRLRWRVGEVPVTKIYPPRSEGYTKMKPVTGWWSILSPILLVGLGTPLQEKWIARNFDELDVPVVWAVGALMDYVAGKMPRAPRWMLDHGLEWLFRFLVEPRRMFRRYIIGNPVFILRVLKQKFRDIF